MHILQISVPALFAIAFLGTAAAAEADVHVLAIKSQNMVNDLAVQAIDLRTMANKTTFEQAKKALESQAASWPNETDSTEKYRPCRSALEKTAYVAELTRMKATSSLDEKVWMLERGKMTKAREACDRAIRAGSVKPT